MNTWLWPDHVISKGESRTLREEHNALVNLNADLLEALREILTEAHYHYQDMDGDKMPTVEAIAINAIVKAGGVA